MADGDLHSSRCCPGPPVCPIAEAASQRVAGHKCKPCREQTYVQQQRHMVKCTAAGVAQAPGVCPIAEAACQRVAGHQCKACREQTYVQQQQKRMVNAQQSVLQQPLALVLSLRHPASVLLATSAKPADGRGMYSSSGGRRCTNR